MPHDAREPAQVVLTDGASRLGVLTDTGSSTRHVEAMLSGCDALVLECNHDPALLAGGPYPGWLKTRIGGPFGHLANDAAAALLAALDRSRLRHVVAAHLSATNNRPGARDGRARARARLRAGRGRRGRSGGRVRLARSRVAGTRARPRRASGHCGAAAAGGLRYRPSEVADTAGTEQTQISSKRSRKRRASWNSFRA